MIPVEELHARIEWDFTNHAPTEDGLSLIVSIRTSAKAFAHMIVGTCPEGREKSLALTHVEEALMYATAALARTLTDDVRS